MKGVILAGGVVLDFILLQREFLSNYYQCMISL